ncbi:hypothetical protein [Candidatus Odyssella thessalonicensis]|uniref:hypothetical protein n=1 Tax=Candidatus Odyssella thessalonicensis TaxID=84647 RepID=UPI000225B6EB|nr:hypothetical protein [Candidatus Odyssella thessalonicensis]
MQTQLCKLMLGLTLVFGQFLAFSMEDNPDYSTHPPKRAAKNIKDDSSAIPNSSPRRPITEESNNGLRSTVRYSCNGAAFNPANKS